MAHVQSQLLYTTEQPYSRCLLTTVTTVLNPQVRPGIAWEGACGTKRAVGHAGDRSPLIVGQESDPCLGAVY